MYTFTEIAAKIAKLFLATDKYHDIVNGPDNATVVVTSGTLPTLAKTIKDFLETNLQRIVDLEDFADNDTIHTHQAQSLTMAKKKQAAVNMGYPSHLNEAAANTAMAVIGQPYFNETLARIQNTTSAV